MNKLAAWVVRAVSVIAFTISCGAFVAIGIPDLGMWTLADLTYDNWRTITESNGVLGIICLVACVGVRIFQKNYFTQQKLLWCVWLNIATVVLTMSIPALAISERRARMLDEPKVEPEAGARENGIDQEDQ